MTVDVSSELKKATRVRGFMMFQCLESCLISYLSLGDDLVVLPVYDDMQWKQSQVVDMSLNNFVKYLSTAYGSIYVEDGRKIVLAMRENKERKKALRFRSNHPLFIQGDPDYQNACLISGMIYVGIPIPDYFDGNELLV